MILTCDIGTSSCKVTLFKLDGALVNSTSSPYHVMTTDTNVEQNPEDWWQGFLKGLLVLREAGSVKQTFDLYRSRWADVCAAWA